MAFKPGRSIKIKKITSERGELSSKETVESINKLTEEDQNIADELNKIDGEIEEQKVTTTKRQRNVDSDIKKNTIFVEDVKKKVDEIDSEKGLLETSFKLLEGELEEIEIEIKRFKERELRIKAEIKILEDELEVEKKKTKEFNNRFESLEEETSDLDDEDKTLYKKIKKLQSDIKSLSKNTNIRFEIVRFRFAQTANGILTNYASIARAWMELGLGTPPYPPTPDYTRIGRNWGE